MAQPVEILLVEDEADSAEVLQNFLELKGYGVRYAAEGEAALRILSDEGTQFSLAILDIMLPGLPGTELLRSIRANPHTRDLPVLFLTAKDREQDEIEGLALGADDYITKPFSLNRLEARLQTLLRRHPYQPRTLAHGPVELDPQAYACRVHGEAVTLTQTEFELLHLLLSHPQRVFSRQEILDRLAPEAKNVFDRTVDTHVKNLRNKLGLEPPFVKTYRGVGYGLRPEDAPATSP